jgi:hypothetical protein
MTCHGKTAKHKKTAGDPAESSACYFSLACSVQFSRTLQPAQSLPPQHAPEDFRRMAQRTARNIANAMSARMK